MTAVASEPEALAALGAGVGDAYATELYKLWAQLSTRVLAVVAVLAPFAFAAVLAVQSGTPADALFGAWVHSSGFAVSLVILGFAGSWGLPVIAGLVAGDLFASEDRHATWKTILTRSCSREELFAGKVLAAGTAVLGMSLLLAVASLVAGFVFAGAHALPNLSGALASPGRLLALTVVAWLYCLIPALAYTSLALLFSIATRNGILGVLGPLFVALLTQLLDLIGRGVIVHLLLIGSAFDGWHGLFVTHPFLGPALVSIVVCVGWIGACLAAGWAIVRRRDFAARSDAGRPSWRAPVAVVLITTAAVAALALASNLGPAGVTGYRVSAAVGPAFSHLTLLQQALIGRHAPASARLDVLPNCNRRGAADIGPGDWNCNLYVYTPQLKSVPFQQTAVEYDVSVSDDGCYKAQSPPAFIGGATMQDARGRVVTNPLFVVYGCFNVL